MKRRQFVAFTLASTLAPAARAQSKPRVVGLLWNDSVKPSPHLAILVEGLRQLGWTHGKNLQVEDSVALDGYTSMGERAAHLVKRRCDVILTYGATATLIASRATKDIPIGMLIGADPVRLGIASSLARPGGNVTGVFTFSQGLIGKRLELLRELAPDVRTVGVLMGTGAAREPEEQNVAENKAAASALKLNLHFIRVAGPVEIDDALARFAKDGMRAVYVAQGTLLAAHSKRIVDAVARHRLVAVYPLDRYAEAGGLLAYAPSARKGFVRLAFYGDRLLRGAKPAETPIEQLSDVEMVINLKTAKAHGIKIPQSILQRVDRAID
jgi:putative tryptophan/tyrosine transport system substrate-binding protein